MMPPQFRHGDRNGPRRNSSGFGKRASFPNKTRTERPSDPSRSSTMRQSPSPSRVKKQGVFDDRGQRGRSHGRPRRSRGITREGSRHMYSSTKQEKMTIPEVEKDVVRIIPLGGVEEVGRNMTAIEFGDEVIVIDCGIQFRGEETPGIDFILPKTKYLEGRKNKVVGMVITHGHLDHIGGIPYIAPRIGNPPIYTRNLTMLMIKKRQEEFPYAPALDLRVVEKDDRMKIGKFNVRFFSVTHTIPDSMGIIIETPYGLIVHTGDLKLDHVDGIPTEEEEQEFGKFDNENVLLLMADSTNVERAGFSIPERIVFKNIEEIIKTVHGRLIVGTFASQIDRIAKIIEIAERYGRKVTVDGHSMKTNVEIARLAKALSYKKETVIPIQEIGNYPPEKIVALVTGAQGDEYAVLMRMANKSHRFISVNQKDTIVLSSSIIPGNERNVQKLKDNLSRQGAKIIHYQVSDVHSSGHANRDETKWIHRKVHPKFFMPIHGYHYMLRVHAEIAREVGMPEKNIVIPDNGMLIEIKDNGEKIEVRKEIAPRGLVLVDGFSIGDIQ